MELKRILGTHTETLKLFMHSIRPQKVLFNESIKQLLKNLKMYTFIIIVFELLMSG
jgi:hypothetical protein